MLKSMIIAATAAIACAGATHAATVQNVDVLSFENVLQEGGNATSILLEMGELFRITADSNDYWSLGDNDTRTINADGDSLATGAPEFGTYTSISSDPGGAGNEFLFGTLIGRIGTGDFFLVGTDFEGTADVGGALTLYNWDNGTAGNSGSILATVTTDISAVPLPASGLLLLGGLAAAGFGARNRKKS